MDSFRGNLPYEVYRAQQAQKAVEEAASTPIDQTVAGGRYLNADGTAVDANGKPIKAGDINAAPAGTHALLGAPADVVYAEMLAQARAEAAAEVEAQKRAEAQRASANAADAKQAEATKQAEAKAAADAAKQAKA